MKMNSIYFFVGKAEHLKKKLYIHFETEMHFELSYGAKFHICDKTIKKMTNLVLQRKLV